MRIHVLDGLRGYAALLVVLSHMPQISDTELGRSFYLMIQDLNLGYLGVDLFFVLSGFLITRILIREKETGKFSFKLFYIKRALRIFPIYFLTIIVCGLIFSWEGMGYLSIYTANYYFTFNVSPHPLQHTWSLSVEEHYYLIWPLIIYFFDSKTIRNYSWMIVALIVLLSLVLVYEIFGAEISDRLIHMGTEFRIISLCLGSTLAFCEKRIMGLKKENASRWLLLFGLVTFLLVILTQQKIFEAWFPPHAMRLFLFSFCSTFIFLLVLLQEKRKNAIDALFGNKYIRYIGNISYGLYLYHFPIFYGWGITKDQLNGKPLEFSEFLLPLLLSVLIASASYKFIEKPLMKCRAKMTSMHNGKTRKLQV